MTDTIKIGGTASDLAIDATRSTVATIATSDGDGLHRPAGGGRRAAQAAYCAIETCSGVLRSEDGLQ